MYIRSPDDHLLPIVKHFRLGRQPEVNPTCMRERLTDANRYGRSTEGEVMRRLALLLDEHGTAKTFRLSSSTFHKIGNEPL